MLCSPRVLVELTVTSEFFWKIVIDRLQLPMGAMGHKLCGGLASKLASRHITYDPPLSGV